MGERTARELTCILQALPHDAGLTPRLGEVVTRLLTTAGQVALRFSQYAEYPARAALMSRTCNPATYYQKVRRFLRIDAAPAARELMQFCTSSRSRCRRSLP